MFNIGGGELLVILLIALIVLGPQRLPDAARQIGKAMADLRKLSTGFQNEVRSAIDTADDPTRVAARRNVLAKGEPVDRPDELRPVRTEPLVAGPGLEPRRTPPEAAPSVKRTSAKAQAAAKKQTSAKKTPAKAAPASRPTKT